MAQQMANPIQYLLKNNPGARITSPFGMRVHPITKAVAMHNGVDIGGVPAGHPWPTPYPGKVWRTGAFGSAGNTVALLLDGTNVLQLFFHLAAIRVKQDQQVKAGDIIGTNGSTGDTTGPHLHYELRIHNGSTLGSPVWGDPQKFTLEGADPQVATDQGVAKGIDVSTHQGTIDWEKVKAAGIQFAMLRVGYATTLDAQFKRNAAECNRLGIPMGVYLFSYALNEAQAKAEAQFATGAIRPYRVEYPVCFDLEGDTLRYASTKGVTIGKAQATAHAAVFLAEVEKAGYYAMNYSNKDYLANMFDMAVLKRYDLWLAWWPTNPVGPGRTDVGIWQYTSKGSVPGIAGNVDMNYAYKDYPAIMKRAGLNHLDKQAAPAPSPEELAAENQALRQQLAEARAEVAQAMARNNELRQMGLKALGALEGFRE
jgi:lysozyme